MTSNTTMIDTSGWVSTSLSTVSLANPSLTTVADGGIISSSAPGAMIVKGDMEVGHDIKMGGRSLTQTLDAIEQRLNILQPNPELETEWLELRELGQRYRQLEAELLEKQKMWATLKR